MKIAVAPFVALACLGLFASMTGCASGSRQPAPARQTSYIRQDDIVYTPATWPQALEADLYLPKGAGPFPGVLLIYGGGWKPSDNRYQMKSIAKQLAARGYVVMNAAYRGAPAFTYPAPVEDLREALRWLHAHADEYRLRTDRVATFGYSAGGHLAALVGLMDGPPELRVQAIVAGGAPSDLTLYPGGDLVPAFLGGTIDQIPATFREASPINHISAGSPPVFLYHAGNDKLVPTEHAVRFEAALTAAGVSHEPVYWIKNRGHITGFLFDAGAEKAAITFLDRVLYAP
ncbi:alpha/beta hydrolase [Rariglobus hedericola]|nr:alpha/beta hydrolase [Rariglobus hedericola]